MSDILERAKAALEGVTDGPWVVNREGWACISSGSDSVFHGYFEGHCGDCGEQVLDEASVAISIEDAEFIAAARDLIPEMLAEIERLRNRPQEPDWLQRKTPNHFRHNGDKSGSHAQFGTICSVTPIVLPGNGHHPHVSVHFRGGVSMDFDTASAIELARRLPEAIAKLPLLPVIHDAVAELEEPA